MINSYNTAMQPHHKSINNPCHNFWQSSGRLILLALIVITPLLILPLASLGNMFEMPKLIAWRIGIELCLVCVVLDWRTKPRSPINRSWIAIILALYALVNLLAMIFSISPALSVWGSFQRQLGVLSLSHYIAFALLLAYWFPTQADKRKPVLALMLAACLTSGYGFLQGLHLDPFRWQDMAFGNRIFSTLGQPNFLGTLLAAVLPMFLAWTWQARLRWEKILLLLASSLLILTIFLTQSRGSLLGLMAGLGLFFVLQVLSRRNWKKFALIAIGGAAILTSLSVTVPELRQVANRALRLDNSTSQTRLLIWQGVWEAIQQRPLLGWGQDTLYYTFPAFYRAGIALTEGPETIPDRAHNWVLDTSYATGMVGLLAYLLLLGALLKTGLKTRRQHPWAVPAMASLGALLVANFFSFDTSTSLLVFWLDVGLLLPPQFATARPVMTKTVSFRKQWKPALMATALCGGALLFFNLRPLLAYDYAARASSASLASDQTEVVANYQTAHRIMPEEVWYTLQLQNANLRHLSELPDTLSHQVLLQEAKDLLHALPAGLQNTFIAARSEAQIAAKAAELSPSTINQATANTAYAAAASHAPELASIQDEWGVLLTLQGNYADAVSHFQTALQWFPNPNWTYHRTLQMHLATALLDENHIMEAKAALDLALLPGPWDMGTFEAWSLLSVAQNALGNLPAAMQAGRKALTYNPSSIPMHQFLLQLLTQNGNQSEAMAEARILLQLDPGNSMALKALGQ